MILLPPFPGESPLAAQGKGGWGDKTEILWSMIKKSLFVVGMRRPKYTSSAASQLRALL